MGRFGGFIGGSVKKILLEFQKNLMGVYRGVSQESYGGVRGFYRGSAKKIILEFQKNLKGVLGRFMGVCGGF